MAKCIQCGTSVGMWSTWPVVVFGVEQCMCKSCSKAHERAYEAADDQGKFTVLERLARAPYLKSPELVRRNLEEARRDAAKRQQEEQLQQEADAARRAYTGTFASCCGRPMTELGVFTFQLGEHTFLGGDFSHLMSGSMKMAFFRCDTCGQLKQFDPAFIQAKDE